MIHFLSSGGRGPFLTTLAGCQTSHIRYFWQNDDVSTISTVENFLKVSAVITFSTSVSSVSSSTVCTIEVSWVNFMGVNYFLKVSALNTIITVSSFSASVSSVSTSVSAVCTQSCRMSNNLHGENT